MNNPAGIYQQRTDGYLQQIRNVRRRLQYIPWGRFILFLAMVCSIWFGVKTSQPGFFISAALSFAAFLLLGWFDMNFRQKIRTFETRIEINQNEIAAINGDYSAFDPGDEFYNENHPYTHDLDIFGKGSLFQCLNRSSTIFGKKKLSDYLSNAYQFRNEIIPRQEAIRELSGKIDFRQELQGIFFEQPTDKYDLPILMDWLGSNPFLGKKAGKQPVDWMKVMTVISYAGPGITILSILLASFGLVYYQLPVLMIILQYLFIYGFGRKFITVNQTVTSQFSILQKYSRALALIESGSFSAGFNRKLQDNLKFNEQLTPSQIIKRLSQLLNLMDSLNMIISAILNGLLMINIHLLIDVEKWRLKYRDHIPRWFEVLAGFDALSGLAAFSFNNPEFIFPEFHQGEFLFKAEKTGHPLIPTDRCVTNDFDITGWKQFYIITGANMSGKSTFLRTIGTNYILAMMGAPVFAVKFIFTPVEIHSSIRTNDSLVKGESYFYAELRSLKEIIGELEQGQRKLILLDEILKGTNSSDKQSGSIALIKQLMKYEVIGIFATHDVAISTLINTYPNHITNLYFEIFIEGDRMEIDYKLRPGVCKNLNASYLMKKMGIVPE